MFDQRGLRADDAETAKAVAERERNDLPDQRIRAQRRDRGKGNVARRHVDVIDAREHELQRTALGAHDEVDPGGVTGQPVLEFARQQQRERHRGDSDGKQHDHQKRRSGRRNA